MLKINLRVTLLGFLLLSSATLIAGPDAGRLRSLSQKVKCDCGCGDVLAECAHVDCTRRPMLKKEISDALLRGQNDDQVLQQLTAAHGTGVLVTPMFRGFDMMLWIVPALLGVSVLGGMVYRFRKIKHSAADR